MSSAKKNADIYDLPPSEGGILLHCCCAPCSAAIMEYLADKNLDFSVFYFNPNIFPREEYEIRKEENKRLAQSLGIEFFDADWRHLAWLEKCGIYPNEPERGARCLECFKYRLLAAARFAQANGFSVFTTTLASSRWKSLDQIREAGFFAQDAVGSPKFWAKNWRKGGLSERRSQLLRQYGFYNQQYCGCEFSLANAKNKPADDCGNPK